MSFKHRLHPNQSSSNAQLIRVRWDGVGGVGQGRTGWDRWAQGWSTVTAGPTHQLLPSTRSQGQEAPDVSPSSPVSLRWCLLLASCPGEAQQPRNQPSTHRLPQHRRYRGVTPTPAQHRGSSCPSWDRCSVAWARAVLSVRVAFQCPRETSSQTLPFF